MIKTPVSYSKLLGSITDDDGDVIAYDVNEDEGVEIIKRINMHNELLRLAISALKPDMQHCDELVKAGLMVYTGNQHNWAWEWKRSAINTLTDRDTMLLYESVKGWCGE